MYYRSSLMSKILSGGGTIIFTFIVLGKLAELEYEYKKRKEIKAVLHKSIITEEQEIKLFGDDKKKK